MSEYADCTEVAKKALEFRQQFYQLLDNPERRGDIVALYAPNTPLLCEWNGHALPDTASIAAYLGGLPRTNHKVDCVDAQPLPGNERADSFLMTVHGVVTYDDEHKREFFQRFVIRKVEERYYIMNDYYRWLSEKE
ncbi:nuclear transport factor 2 protein, putative [Trypanosoma equiperdum]|uniref:NTF2-related export protein n=4 Tax=Trypanozoon TaxID=39700 RepID=Q582J1_TRYB2|nr:nuclear transport factor 2 protein, putative [Trypanosoma brucei gambiense DAL972]XP_846199.1 nuclear transport factor 2 protein, putative [Trypanosoma brucei brucei TREU927]AAX78840.1 nuclear transport factor 2 protein, putative [Trypanosoma brucei]RHW71752.1 nuclear transport factor 2 protein [Trypanosoma brucei equiperdum]SCU65662.1 nuclear transport factor 2 protein, putative [Trypanosoma equiperdum]AAZ12640.1 nuclear transport factor 2 protein, putative [Trypanosoma brucei brucei TREU9|eukprot:XP_011775056.1 nuclear transport factor 2 protein, putative [Trypanosoma brucei gambiense DAL972]